MPYSWTTQPRETPGPVRELRLWPHQSLRANGYVGFIGATFVLIMVPVFSVLGSVALWGIQPFLIATFGGLWLALDRSRHNAQICEILTLSGDQAHLVRRDPGGTQQEWACNRYWAHPEIHANSGPVPQYVTLTGAGRKVEIGAFLSEDERVALYDDLVTALRKR